MNKSAFERKPVSGAETAARRLDPAPLEASGTFLNAAGLVLEDVSGSRVVGHIEIGPARYTPWGIVHGGVYTTAVESAASIGASAAVRDQGMVAVGLTNTTHFLRSRREGTVRVEAVALNQGRAQQLWRVELTDEVGRLVAHGLAPPTADFVAPVGCS